MTMAKKVRLLPVNKLYFRENESLQISSSLAKWWDSYSSEYPWIFDGEIVGCCKVTHTEDCRYNIDWQKARYCQYIVRKDSSTKIETIKIMYCSVAILTSDNSLLVCRTADKTSSPGMLLLPGGNIELVGGEISIASITGDAVREVKEEIGLALDFETLNLWRIKIDGDFGDVGFIFQCRVPFSEHEIQISLEESIARDIARGRLPEIQKCLFIDNSDSDLLNDTNSVDYLSQVLGTIKFQI